MNSTEDQIFHVPADQAQQTVASALRHWLPSCSWSQVKQLLRTRRIMVSGNICLDESRRLQVGEVVKVLAHSAAPPPKEQDVRVRYLDAHLLLVEKPSGMTTLRHPEEKELSTRRRQLQPTLDECLPRIVAKVEKKSLRPGSLPMLRAVHRLDRETSGLMVFARTVPAERHLGLQFRNHTVHRRYIALVHGHVSAQTIRSTLVRDRGDGRRGSATEEDEEGKEAVTHVMPLEHLDGYTVLQCRLETGRTHQIRIHLSELGHPVCGDKVYLGRYVSANKETFQAPRLALHAAELGLQHPATGEWLEASMPLPDDLAGFLHELRTQTPNNRLGK